MLKNIDSLPVKDCFGWLARLAKLYAVLFLLQLFFFVSNKNFKGDSATLSTVQLVFYGVNTAIICLTYYYQTILLCTIACFSLTAVTVINAVIMISAIVGGNYFALVSILSIVISSTTIFIIYKIRGKLMNPDSSSNTSAMLNDNMSV